MQNSEENSSDSTNSSRFIRELQFDCSLCLPEFLVDVLKGTLNYVHIHNALKGFDHIDIKLMNKEDLMLPKLRKESFAGHMKYWNYFPEDDVMVSNITIREEMNVSEKLALIRAKLYEFDGIAPYFVKNNSENLYMWFPRCRMNFPIGFSMKKNDEKITDTIMCYESVLKKTDDLISENSDELALISTVPEENIDEVSLSRLLSTIYKTVRMDVDYLSTFGLVGSHDKKFGVTIAVCLLRMNERLKLMIKCMEIMDKREEFRYLYELHCSFVKNEVMNLILVIDCLDEILSEMNICFTNIYNLHYTILELTEAEYCIIHNIFLLMSLDVKTYSNTN